MSYIGQREDEWEAEQKKKAKRQYNRDHPRCTVCGKRPKNLDAHLKDAHGMKRVPTPKYMLIDL
jgi:ribosomal protein S14